VCVPWQAAVQFCMHGRPGKYGGDGLMGLDGLRAVAVAVAVPVLAAAGTTAQDLRPPPGTSTCGGAPVCSYSAGSTQAGRHQAPARVSSPLHCMHTHASSVYGNGRRVVRVLYSSACVPCWLCIASWKDIFHQIRIRWVTCFVPGPVHEHAKA
jgi:hypothetical protein